MLITENMLMEMRYHSEYASEKPLEGILDEDSEHKLAILSSLTTTDLLNLFLASLNPRENKHRYASTSRKAIFKAMKLLISDWKGRFQSSNHLEIGSC